MGGEDPWLQMALTASLRSWRAETLPEHVDSELEAALAASLADAACSLDSHAVPLAQPSSQEDDADVQAALAMSLQESPEAKRRRMRELALAAAEKRAGR